MDSRLKVFFGCIIGIIALSLFFWWYDSVVSSGTQAKNEYTIKVDQNLSYKDDNLTVVIGTDRKSSSRSLSIYGIDKSGDWRIFSSLMSGDGNMDVNAQNIEFNGSETHPFTIGDTPNVIPVSVLNLERGIYHGWFYISGKSNFTIPITILTDPKIVQAITLVIIGVVLSIALWEIIFYIYVILSKIIAEEKKKKATKIVNRENPNNQIDVNSIMGLTDTDFQNRNIADTPKIQINSLRDSARKRERKANNTAKRYEDDMGKIFTVDGAVIGFGILTGLIGVFNNTYVMNLVQINLTEMILLIGIGLGIGSLKGFVDKPKSDE